LAGTLINHGYATLWRRESMKRLSEYVLIAVFVALPVSADAQFSVPKLGAVLGGGSGGNLGGQLEQLQRVYVGANKEVLHANSKMAEALGLKDEAVKARATSDSLNEGATKDNLSDADKVQSDTSLAIATRLKDSPELDASAKATYAAGLRSLGGGVLKYVQMKPNIEGVRSSISKPSAGMLAAGSKVGVASYIVTSFPTNLTNLTSALNGAISFAKSRDIPVPDDATKALASN